MEAIIKKVNKNSEEKLRTRIAELMFEKGQSVSYFGISYKLHKEGFNYQQSFEMIELMFKKHCFDKFVTRPRHVDILPIPNKYKKYIISRIEEQNQNIKFNPKKKEEYIYLKQSDGKYRGIYYNKHSQNVFINNWHNDISILKKFVCIKELSTVNTLPKDINIINELYV